MDRHIGYVYGQERMAGVADALGNLHNYLQTLPRGTVVTIFGNSLIFGDSHELFIFLGVKESGPTQYWELVRLCDEGNKKMKTWLIGDLPVTPEKFDYVRVSDFVDEIRLEFLAESQNAGEGVKASVSY